MLQISDIVHAKDPNFKYKSEVVKRPPVEVVLKSIQPNIVNLPKLIPINEIPLLKGIDEESQVGHFGWPAADNDFYSGIPYIQRDREKYFATRMIEMKQPIGKYLQSLHPAIYTYYYKITVYATEAEARLFNEINRQHCDIRFGPLAFTTESLLVKTSDAYALYEFLDTCYRKLSFCTQIISNKIGFMQLYTYIVVPFVSINGERYMPLHCFSNTNNLQIDFISGWDLAYMKCCCLYQGTWKEYDTMPVVSLTSLKANLPSNTQFEICWPNTNDHTLINTTPKNNVMTVRANSLSFRTESIKRQILLANGPKSGTMVRSIQNEPPTKIRREK